MQREQPPCVQLTLNGYARQDSVTVDAERGVVMGNSILLRGMLQENMTPVPIKLRGNRASLSCVGRAICKTDLDSLSLDDMQMLLAPANLRELPDVFHSADLLGMPCLMDGVVDVMIARHGLSAADVLRRLGPYHEHAVSRVAAMLDCRLGGVLTVRKFKEWVGIPGREMMLFLAGGLPLERDDDGVRHFQRAVVFVNVTAVLKANKLRRLYGDAVQKLVAKSKQGGWDYEMDDADMAEAQDLYRDDEMGERDDAFFMDEEDEHILRQCPEYLVIQMKAYQQIKTRKWVASIEQASQCDPHPHITSAVKHLKELGLLAPHALADAFPYCGNFVLERKGGVLTQRHAGDVCPPAVEVDG